MAAIVSLLLVLSLSLLVVRVATAALALTGVTKELARFQARSAFTGVGFTTSESEQIAGHPVRRRIIALVMLLGNAGVVTAISSLVLSFVNTERGEALHRLLWLGAGVVLLWVVALSPWVDHRLQRFIEWALRRWTRLQVMDYVRLLELSGPYSVREMLVERYDWVADRRLRELDLAQEGVLVLGIRRSPHDYVGAPTAESRIEPGDTLILYGRDDALDELDQRRSGAGGDVSHERAVDEQSRVVEEQERQERARDH